jgi:8-oxo-dGTP pyrophosphatase MutT (NUDIX family)
MALELPRIEDIDEIDLKVVQRPWPFAIEESQAIDRHWEKLRAQKPNLFNGRVFLNFERGLETRGEERVLRGSAATVDFKAFLAWRDFGFPGAHARNCFSMAALLSADGAFVLGRMSESTANAGKIYFPAGTPDLDDVKDGALDLEGSVLRELAEETGIGAGEVDLAPGWSVVFEGPLIACMKLTRSRLSAAEIAARFKTFIASQARPELVALHPVFSVRDLDHGRMPQFTLRYLRRALARRDSHASLWWRE